MAIETIHSYDLKEAMAQRRLAERVCIECPLSLTCLPFHRLSGQPHSLIDSLLGYKKKYDVNVFGYEAGGNECLLVKKDSPIEFKKIYF
ncbi:hypothetical protein HY502_01495 [Candidatus Woesebacteria bacterium]|nr:hypothetical protein [Candidatus Woesebacteria bacterium]